MITVPAQVKEDDIVKALKFSGVYKSQSRASASYTHFWVAVFGDHRRYARTEKEAWIHYRKLKKEYKEAPTHD